MKGVTFEYANFDESEKIRYYMEYHKEEVFTPEFMKLLADRFLNYNTVRERIKKLYPSIVMELIENNTIDIFPNEETEYTKKGQKQQWH